MELQHVNVKVYVDGELPVDPARFIDIFHQWTREQTMDELLIDVADYRHVPAGPGVMLIGHEADYSMDNADNRWGLLYNRKAPTDGSNHDRFRQALTAALKACHLLETGLASEGPLAFSRSEFDIYINDRALAPNTPETFSACKPEVESFLADALGHREFDLTHRSDPRARFGIRVVVAKPFDSATLLDTLQADAQP